MYVLKLCYIGYILWTEVKVERDGSVITTKRTGTSDTTSNQISVRLLDGGNRVNIHQSQVGSWADACQYYLLISSMFFSTMFNVVILCFLKQNIYGYISCQTFSFFLQFRTFWFIVSDTTFIAAELWACVRASPVDSPQFPQHPRAQVCHGSTPEPLPVAQYIAIPLCAQVKKWRTHNLYVSCQM